ncbi:MAG: hypothetical protein MR878_01110 [Campylobacter sp.]|uniref:hypothetical protein n=1 Tax=Campylobacter sp. TaxID=205 RepID=UPI002AA70CC4|nr:hypothetical protein [Campylobacter sp.]MCI7013971.1 hypothetical protein [Campylobacter sp.]
MGEENKKIFTSIEDEWVKVDKDKKTITVTIPEAKEKFETIPYELKKYGEYNIKIVLNYTSDSSSSFHLYFLTKIEFESLSIECDLKPSDNKYYGDTRLKISNNFIIDGLKAKELKLKNIEFNTKCDLYDIEVDKLIIDNCIFNYTFSITSHNNYAKNQFAKHILAKNIKFNSNLECAYNIFETLDISKSEIMGSANFKNCVFQEIQSKEERKKEKEKTFHNFSEIHFKDNVYFDDSYFNKFADFRLCVFEKTASFYSTKFKVIPNFSQGDFKGILNINNATWGQNGNLEFEDVRSIVKKAYGKSEKEEDELEKIRNIKDSFRTIKNVLIQKNDQLEAQKFHKAELYCKELELEKELETKNNKNFSTYIDSLLLGFYRINSDHHTNFLKILNFTVFCIAVYAVCSFVFVDIYTATFFGESIIFSKNTSEGIFSWLSAGLFFLAIIILLLVIKYSELKTFLIYFGLFFAIVVVAVLVNNFCPTIAKILLLFGIITFLLLSTITIEKGLRLFSFSYLCFCAIPALSSIVYFLEDKDKNYALLFKITIPAIISTYFCLVIFFSYLLEEIDLRKIKDKNLILSVFKYLVWVFKYLVLVFKYLAWGIVAFVLYLYPQLINPFVDVFKSDEILSTNYFEKNLNDLNASEIIKISNLLKNSTDLNLTEMHKKIIDSNTTTNAEIIDSNTTTNAEIINAKELIKQNLKEINIANKELNATVNKLKVIKDHQEYLVNGIKSSLLVYSIILLLCLYSLTKTARKNSIVPI